MKVNNEVLCETQVWPLFSICLKFPKERIIMTTYTVRLYSYLLHTHFFLSLQNTAVHFHMYKILCKMETMLCVQVQALLHFLLSRKVRLHGFNCNHQIARMLSLETEEKARYATQPTCPLEYILLPVWKP